MCATGRTHATQGTFLPIWAYQFGLEKGEGGKYNAKTPCTRGYVVTYLYRFMTGNELAQKHAKQKRNLRRCH